MANATSITLLENGRLEMVEQNALLFDGKIAYDDNYTGLVLDNVTLLSSPDLDYLRYRVRYNYI